MGRRIVFHVLFWTAIVIWRTNGDYMRGVGYEQFLIHNLLRLPMMIVATYTVVYYLLPVYIINTRRYLLFVALLIAVLAIATQVDQLISHSDFMKSILQVDTPHQLKIVTQAHPYRNSFLLFAIMGIASLIRFFRLYTEQEQRKNELIQENLETKYAFLKTQVNPHFLFNALNNIYSMAIHEDKPEIAQSIENLSGIMQYLTYDSDAKKVPLEKEILLLKNYIDIEQLRFDSSDDITISFNTVGDINNLLIAPVILLPLVENAFKHGIKPDEKCLISIKLVAKNNSLEFITKNTHFEYEDREIKESGIGLENVKKRLQLIYPDQHDFSISEDAKYYHTRLTISL